MLLRRGAIGRAPLLGRGAIMGGDAPPPPAAGDSFDPAFPSSATTLVRRNRAQDLSGIGSGISSWPSTATLVSQAAWVQGAGAARPTLRSTNGVQWAEFDGGDHMTLETGTLDLAGTHTFALVKLPSTGVHVILGNTSTNVQVGANAGAARVAGNPLLWSNALSAPDTITGAWQIVEAELLATGTSYIAVDGTVAITTPAQQADPVLVNALGATTRADPFPAGSMTGGIADMLVYPADGTGGSTPITSEERTALLRAERTRLATALTVSPLVVKVWPSDANFVLVETTDSERFTSSARNAGILVRVFPADPALTDCVRITVGRPEDNDRLLQAVSSKEATDGD